MQDSPSKVLSGSHLVCIDVINIQTCLFRMLTMLIVFRMFSTDFANSVMRTRWTFHSPETSNCAREKNRSPANVEVFPANIFTHGLSRVPTWHIFAGIRGPSLEARLNRTRFQKPATLKITTWNILCRIRSNGNQLHPFCMTRKCRADLKAFHVTHFEQNCKVRA